MVVDFIKLRRGQDTQVVSNMNNQGSTTTDNTIDVNVVSVPSTQKGE
jgi:hypothetical protein